MQVEMGLGEQTDVTHAFHPKILPHRAEGGKSLCAQAAPCGIRGPADTLPGRCAAAPARHRAQRASASSFWIRETPSTRSSSPSA
ncbi:hypothetical protein GCM10023347_27040 [Streptomyces chumphonensis]